MKLAEGIRRHGFRKWYEHELLRSHGHMVLTVLCTLGLVGALEATSGARSPGERWSDLGTILLCVAVGLWSLRRYLFLLSHAEAVANQAVCPQCDTYGRLDLVEARIEGPQLRVRCRHCAREWSIDA